VQRDMTVKDDRLLAPTLWTAVLIVPVLVAAFVILFLDRTRQLWAWTIAPSMTAMVMGAGYLSGAYFFVRVATVRRWHRVWPGFVSTTLFTTVLLLATLLHWDKFDHGHVSFWAWLTLYVVTPALLPWLWWLNRRTDPGTAEPGDVRVDRRLRLAVATAGALQLLVAAVILIRPGLAIAHAPWKLTPLTARTLSAFIAFPAATMLCFLADDRWSSFRIPFETATFGLCLVGLAAIRAHGDLQGPRSSVALFVFALVIAIVLLIALQVVLDRREGAATPAGTSGSPSS